MQPAEFETDRRATAPWLGKPVWSFISGRLNRLGAAVHVGVNAHGVPALATFLMQGLVL